MIQLTTWIGIKEPDGSAYDCTEHPVVQHAGGIDTDQIEHGCAHKVEDDGDQSDPTVDALPLVVSKEADGLYTFVAGHVEIDVYHFTVWPAKEKNWK